MQEKFKAEIKVILIAAFILTKVWRKNNKKWKLKNELILYAPQRPTIFPNRQNTVSLYVKLICSECMALACSRAVREN